MPTKMEIIETFTVKAPKEFWNFIRSLTAGNMETVLISCLLHLHCDDNNIWRKTYSKAIWLQKKKYSFIMNI